MQFYDVTIQRSNGKHFYWHGKAQSKTFAEIFALDRMDKQVPKQGAKVLSIVLSSSPTKQETFSLEV